MRLRSVKNGEQKVPIKYEHALGEDNTAINIQDVSEGDRSKVFSCLGCGNQLIPVLGNIVERHFRHNAELSCSGETYLHRLAKIKFHSAFANALSEKKPFLVEIPRTNQCDFYLEKLGLSCTARITKQFDLAAHFSEPPLLESRWENFIPDVLLQTEKGVPLFIEIKVSHGCSDEKIESGHRIIEIEVDSADTIDFESVLREGRWVKFYNFKSSLEKVNCNGNCTRQSSDLLYSQDSFQLRSILANVAEWVARKRHRDVSCGISLQDIDDYNKYKADKSRIFGGVYDKLFIIDGREVMAYNRRDAIERLADMPEIYRQEFEYLEDPDDVMSNLDNGFG